ncbi:MAG TPA: translation elongation factor Ts [Xanthomonadaceae bacterium]|nr:translation elongation factor Ts [Xanthomonadaceae bacterium]
MQITAAQVKELRERSGAGMMECKKALTENGGDIDVAIEWLRKQGLAKADKKAGRVAAEGRLALASTSDGRRAALVEVNCETDFVAKDANFAAFADAVAAAVLDKGVADAEAVKALPIDGGSVEDARQALVAKIGENIQFRRAELLDGAERIGAYLHGTRIGVLVAMNGGSDELAKDIAMHIAALKPAYVHPDAVPADFVAKEKEIALAQVQDTGKPADILEKMVQGKVKKTLAEICLTGQPFVKGDGKETVEQVLNKAGASVASFVRLEVGEGIEKKEEDFAAEVMKQAGLA